MRKMRTLEKARRSERFRISALANCNWQRSPSISSAFLGNSTSVESALVSTDAPLREKIGLMDAVHDVGDVGL